MNGLNTIRIRLAAVAFMIALLWGCSDDSSQGSNDCVPGQSISCACTNGETGAQICQDSGAFGACSCDSSPDGGGGANACGGSSELRIDGEIASPGDTCGDCADGVVACAGPDSLNCVGASSLNACGACQTLGASPGDECGECSTGVLACADDGSLECSATDDLNACGGCEELDEEPFFTCTIGEATGVFYCRDEETVVCVGPDQNACGGDQDLGDLPTSRCGVCSQGRWSCDGQNAIVCEKANAGVNSCGGCAPLVGEPGEDCACGGSWQCSGSDRVVCSRGNLCGGCAELSAQPGSSCGSGRVNVCDGAEAIRCVDESEANACGGSADLLAMPGASCGECDDGTRICVSPNAVACRGASRTNECGGCTYLTRSEGDPCGNGGMLQCDGSDDFVCVGQMGDNGCGGTVSLPAVPGTDCDCGTWVCDGEDAVICSDPADLMTSSEHCGVCDNPCGPTETCVMGNCSGSMGSSGISVAAGNAHSCATDGSTVWCWGQNNQGQLGLGNTAAQSSAVTVAVPGAVSKLAAGYAHTCALREDAVLYCWGDNARGQIGRGNTGGTTTSPQPVTSLSGVTDVAAGKSHTCAIASGEVYCWGSTQFGQLGNGATGTGEVNTPVRIGTFTDATQVVAGDDFTCVLHGAGSVSCWGQNASGQLASGSSGGTQSTPQSVTIAPATGLGAGAQHACAIVGAGTVRCWGNDDYRQSGGSSFGDITTPAQVGGASNVVVIDAGRYHTCALRGDNSVICWGDSDSSGTPGERYEPPLLGTGSLSGSNIAVPVTAISGVEAIAVGQRHTCAFIDSGNVSCWGDGANGRLGDNQRDPAQGRVLPVEVVGVGTPRTEASQCTDGIDNDGAGGADCADAACSTIISSTTATGNLFGEGNYFTYNSSTCGMMMVPGGGGDGADQLFTWVAPANGLTTVDVASINSSGFSGAVVVLDSTGCPGTQIACGDSFSGVSFTATANSTYRILVESYGFEYFYSDQAFEVTITQ